MARRAEGAAERLRDRALEGLARALWALGSAAVGVFVGALAGGALATWSDEGAAARAARAGAVVGGLLAPAGVGAALEGRAGAGRWLLVLAGAGLAAAAVTTSPLVEVEPRALPALAAGLGGAVLAGVLVTPAPPSDPWAR